MYREENENNIAREGEETLKNKNEMPLSAQQLKERISFAAVLRADGVKVMGNGEKMECRCPNPEHHDSTPSFKITNDQRAFCFGCGWKGDVIEYVKMRDRSDFLSAFTWLEENIGRFPRTTKFIADQADARSTTGPKPLTEVEKERCVAAAKDLADDPRAWHTVAYERDWQPELIGDLARAGDLGWHGDQLAFIFDTGMKVREWPGRDFRWNCGSPSLWRGRLLDEECGAIFIAEGETDAISLLDGDVENAGGTVVAIPSSTTIRPEWFQVMKDQVVILCFDNDDAGRIATKKVAKMLEGIADRIRYIDFGDSGFNDISDVHAKLGRKKLIDWLTAAMKPFNPPPDDGGDKTKAPDPASPAPNGASAKTSTHTKTLPDIYYSTGTKEYYLEAENGSWIPVNENSVKRHLKAAGFKHGKEDVTPLEGALNDVQRKQNVVYAAPLAGHDAGIHVINGVNVLATSSPKFITPKAGEFPVLKEMLTRMFATPTRDQLPYLYAWLKLHLQCFHARKWAPHQAMAFCGPVDCGKSLLQRLITELFGGRSAKPHQYMSGNTNFNADLFEAEHLMVEDDAESTNHAQRKTFGAHLKAFAANRDQRCHGKYMKGLILHPLWAVTISVNDEPQRLLVLPPVDQDTEDKIMLLKVNQCVMPMSTETLDEKDKFWNILISELPAFVHFLSQWEIPNELRSAKYGVKHYHDPEILEAVDEISNELRLLTLIDQGISFHRGEPWKGTAHELEQHLGRENSPVQYDARKLFYFPTACGSYLANLAKKHPHRVVKLPRSKDSRDWQINPLPEKLYSGMVKTSAHGEN